MTKALSPGKGDIAIKLIHSNQYESWLKNEKNRVQNWLNAQGFKGKGAQAIPGEDGKIAFVVYGLEDFEGMFLSADLATQLPQQNYYLDLENSLLPDSISNPQSLTTRFGISWGLASYSFDRYKPNEKDLPALCIEDKKTFEEVKAYVKGITLARDLVNTPAGDLMPEHLTQECQKLAEQFDASMKEIVGEDLLDQNYPSIHAVGRASVHAPRLIDLTWGNPQAPKITLVGKGVCFDSGGLDLKPSNFMRLMKKDMGGAAHVLGLAYLIMSQNLPVRLRVLIPAVENAVSSNAFRPGDVLNTRKGLTVEVDNTDAEGRLVLCDALTEADSESPDIIIDFATLTGACRVALGTELPGYFSNKDDLALSIYDYGEKVDDPVWRLPLHKPYQDMLKSDIADTLNSAPTGHGGAITAALYLQLFVSKETPWLHFDVMAWNNRKLPGRPVGGEAFGIRAVFEYLKNTYA